MKRIYAMAALLAGVLAPASAWATQQHADPEGFYSHQIAHIFFIATMAILAVQIRRSAPGHPGWSRIGRAALLFLAWNVTTFTVHVLGERITPEYYTGSARAWTQALDVSTPLAQAFYAGKILDHVFLALAVLVFLRGVQALTAETHPPPPPEARP